MKNEFTFLDLRACSATISKLLAATSVKNFADALKLAGIKVPFTEAIDKYNLAIGVINKKYADLAIEHPDNTVKDQKAKLEEIKELNSMLVGVKIDFPVITPGTIKEIMKETALGFTITDLAIIKELGMVK